MKTLFIMCMLLITIAAQSQSKTFVKIYDELGSKIRKGYIINASDSSITISLNTKTFEIPAEQISVIKLRRSFGRTILITALIVGVSRARRLMVENSCKNCKSVKC